MRTLTLGTKVKILTGKHKGKSAVVKELNSTQLCCSLDNFYLWFFPDSLEECEEEDWGGNGDYAGDNRWNPAHFGGVPRRCESNGQMTIWFDCDEPPDPDDYQSKEKYEAAWQQWEMRQVAA